MILLGSLHISKLQMVAAQFPQVSEVRRVDEGCSNKIRPEQAGSMDGIPEISLLPFGLFHIFRMGQDRPEIVLYQDVENGDPIFACGIHEAHFKQFEYFLILICIVPATKRFISAISHLNFNIKDWITEIII